MMHSLFEGYDNKNASVQWGISSTACKQFWLNGLLPDMILTHVDDSNIKHGSTSETTTPWLLCRLSSKKTQ